MGTKSCMRCGTDNWESSAYCKECGQNLMLVKNENWDWFRRHRVITGFMISFAIGFMVQFLQDFNNPYLTASATMMRALIQGVGMVFIVIIVYAVNKLFSGGR